MFNFPNVWQLRLGDGLRQVILPAPIDDENVMLYVRAYQKPTRLAFIGRIAGFIGAQFNRVILAEDYAITVTQQPKKSDLNIGERFIPADRPIALYLQHRRNLIMAAQTDDAYNSEPESVL